jgi:hypothetical protein
MDDPTALTLTIQAACRQLGVRAIVSKGWSRLGSNVGNTPAILFIDDCPHGKNKLFDNNYWDCIDIPQNGSSNTLQQWCIMVEPAQLPVDY